NRGRLLIRRQGGVRAEVVLVLSRVRHSSEAPEFDVTGPQQGPGWWVFFDELWGGQGACWLVGTFGGDFQRRLDYPERGEAVVNPSTAAADNPPRVLPRATEGIGDREPLRARPGMLGKVSRRARHARPTFQLPPGRFGRPTDDV